MKRVFVTPFLLLLILLTGCAREYVDVRGEKFEKISRSEELQLVDYARLSMRGIAKKLPPADLKSIETREPEMRFIYDGDRFGRVFVSWSFPGYTVGVEYEGQLMTKYMKSIVFSKRKNAEVVDFVRRGAIRPLVPRTQEKDSRTVPLKRR